MKIILISNFQSLDYVTTGPKQCFLFFINYLQLLVLNFAIWTRQYLAGFIFAISIGSYEKRTLFSANQASSTSFYFSKRLLVLKVLDKQANKQNANFQVQFNVDAHCSLFLYSSPGSISKQRFYVIIANPRINLQVTVPCSYPLVIQGRFEIHVTLPLKQTPPRKKNILMLEHYKKLVNLNYKELINGNSDDYTKVIPMNRFVLRIQ